MVTSDVSLLYGYDAILSSHWIPISIVSEDYLAIRAADSPIELSR